MSARDDLAFLARVDAAMKADGVAIEQKAQDVIAIVLARLAEIDMRPNSKPPVHLPVDAFSTVV